jgi:hypothetical protein
MKGKPCILIFHGSCKEIRMGRFETITEARDYAKRTWDRPYSIKPIKPTIMIEVLVPTFDHSSEYRFKGFEIVKIKEKPDHKDVNAITKLLPGIPIGGIGKEPLVDLLKNGYKPIKSFYDIRQNTKRFGSFNVYLKNVK